MGSSRRGGQRGHITPTRKIAALEALGWREERVGHASVALECVVGDNVRVVMRAEELVVAQHLKRNGQLVGSIDVEDVLSEAGGIQGDQGG